MTRVNRQKRRKQLLIFDLDGTLYQLPGGSYVRSPLRVRVKRNVIQFLTRQLSISVSEAQEILKKIEDKYGENISVALERDYGIGRAIYFETVWDISTRGIVYPNPSLRRMLLKLQNKFRIILLSDAPRIWINNVLATLNIVDIFRQNIYSGEGDRRKGAGNAFSEIAKKLGYRPASCIVVGDQEDTDILQAQKVGMRSIYISKNLNSKYATFNIHKLQELLDVLMK